MSEAHITLHDVAALAGVSVATASRALTGTKVTKANQDKVAKAAAELGYVPNEAARSLRSVRTMTVGVVFSHLSSPLATEVLDALASTFEARGYSLFVSTAQGQGDRFDTLVHRFLERRVDALLCINAEGTGAALPRYAAAGIPVAAVFPPAGGYEHLPMIGPSSVEAAHECVARLAALGHKHIAILKSRRSRPLENVRKAACDLGMTVKVVEVQENSMEVLACLNSLMSESPRPTAIVARQADAVRAFEAADELSILMPRMLSLVSLRDESHIMPTTRTPMSTIHLNPAMVGEAAAARLLEQLSGGAEIEPETLVEIASWIERGTTGPAPAQSPSTEGKASGSGKKENVCGDS